MATKILAKERRSKQKKIKDDRKKKRLAKAAGRQP